MESEQLTLLALKQGDAKVFESVFKTYYTQLCIHVRRYVIDPDAAEEVVQDMFFKVWEKRNVLSVHTSLNAYLYRAATNQALNYIKYQKVTSQYKEYVGFTTNTATESNAHEELVSNDLETKIDFLIKSLPERRRMVFEMSRFEGLKYHEIAEKLKISVKTVEIQMSKALAFLRDNLKEYLPALVMGLFFWWIK
ncbi:MAG: RNA polymerase sigma-70 factor [Lentimicrobiaceae bacterium]|nr:RNA polymerase sigma-70 factor [Lentimicrobiaceae bacterium]